MSVEYQVQTFAPDEEELAAIKALALELAQVLEDWIEDAQGRDVGPSHGVPMVVCAILSAASTVEARFDVEIINSMLISIMMKDRKVGLDAKARSANH